MKLHIDKFGLTHFSCTVMEKYNETNHFNSPPKVCLNGQFFSKYFLGYVASVFRKKQEENRSKPVLSYMHFNTGHTFSGTRIRNIDDSLAKFLLGMARDQETLTIVLADHGHKSTRYGQTAEGIIEQFDPLFFMVVPHGVAKLLGESKMAALFENQRRLFTTVDIFYALMALNNPEKSNSRDPSVSGIFAVLPDNRTCAELSLLPLTKCICAGKHGRRSIVDNSAEHEWLAEFALGTINNAIQEQYRKGKRGIM